MLDITVMEICEPGQAKHYELSPRKVLLGTLLDNGVDKIRVSVPDAWAGKAVRVTIVPRAHENNRVAQLVGSDGTAEIAANMSQYASSGHIVVDATSTGYSAHTNAIAYQYVTHPDVGGTAPDPSTTEYQQFVADTLENRNAAESYAKSAQGYAQEAAGSASDAQASAGTAAQQANAASTNKDATDKNVSATDAKLTEATQMAVIAAEQKAAAEEAANRAEAAAASFPMRYYRSSVYDMESITSAKQGDLCYVTDYTAHESTLYTYDTTDMDSDNVSPEWVLIGYLKFADLNRDDLLSILQLATVSVSGSYNDLTDKPNRYESFAVVSATDGTVTWDYTTTDKIKITLETDAELDISGVYNGSCGVIELYGGHELTLPANAEKAFDWDYMDALAGQHYMITWLYDGVVFHFSRTVCGNAQ